MRLNFATRLGLIICGIAALAVGGAGGLAYLSGRSAILRTITAELYARAIEKQSSIESWADDLLREVGELADSPELLRFAGQVGHTTAGGPDPQAELRRLLTQRAMSDRELVELALLDAQSGRLIAGSAGGDQLVPILDTIASHARAGPWAGEAAKAGGGFAVAAAVPLRLDDRPPLILAALLNPGPLPVFVHRRSGLRQSDDAYLLSGSGAMLVPFLQAGPAGQPGPAPGASESTRHCLEHADGLVPDDDLMGRPTISVYRWLPRLRWCLVVTVARAEALSGIADYGRELAAAAALTIAVALALSMLIAQSVTRPVRGLEAGASRVAMGDRDVRFDDRSSDEIGQLARALNRMTAALAASESKIRDHMATLELRVAAKTRQVSQHAAELERSNQELERFAYVASHDLQEPLRMVASFTQLLGKRYRGRLDADADDFIGFAVDGAARMQALINDLLAFARVTTKAKDFEPIDCELVLDLALRNLRSACEESGAIITRDALPVLRADASQLGQVFQNFVANAIKFRGDRPPAIHVGATRQEHAWQFCVIDNGIGIDPKHAGQLFVLFRRLHSRAQYPGTGIGLAICKKIVERHGGRVWLESEPGKGARFYFTIADRLVVSGRADADDTTAGPSAAGSQVPAIQPSEIG